MGSSSTTRTRPSFMTSRAASVPPRARRGVPCDEMATVPPLARAYEALRPRILQRLLELRSTLDPGLGRLDEATARAQVSAVLEHLGNFIATGDLRLHRAFLQAFLAMRAAEAQSPASVLATLVAI